MNHTFFQSIRYLITRSLVAVGVFGSSAILAHPGHAIENTHWAGSLLAGITHPLSGFDHLVMFLAVGFISAQFTNMKQSVGAISFATAALLLGMGLGALTGFSMGIESVILGSLFIASLAVYFQKSGLKTALSALALSLVLFHGWAHGLESSGQVLFGFVPGMLLSTLSLMGGGYAMASKMSHKWQGAFLVGSSIMVALVS